MIDWPTVLVELESFAKKTITLSEMGDMALDTLYGSMYGLNHRYMNLEESLAKDASNIVAYSIKRIRRLLNIKPATFKHRALPSVRWMGFGTYGWKYNPKIIKIAVNNGLLIDTAEGYGYGRVEQKLGDVLSRNDKTAIVTTKVSRSHMSPKAIAAAANRSKQRLGITPHYQLHYPHASYSDEQLGMALATLRETGTIASIGLGNCSVDMIESMQSFLSDYSGDCIRTIQVRYNLLDRRIEKSLIPYCQRRGIAIIGYSPLGQKFSLLHRPILDVIARKKGCSPAQVALAWIYRVRGIIPIPRTNDVQHLKANIAAMDVVLDQESINALNQEYPYDRRNG